MSIFIHKQDKNCLALQALMKINCDGPSDNDFDPEEATNKWLFSGPGDRHIAGHKVPVPRVSVPNRPVATATATATATSSRCHSKGPTVSTTLSDAERQRETEEANARSVNVHSSDS